MTVEEYYKALRSLQLYLTVLNGVNKNLIFTMKVNCLGFSIASGYAALAHFSDQPVFGTMYYVVFVEALFIYSAIYEKAFRVPHLMSKASRACRLRARSLTSKFLRTGLERQFKSIPAVGIKVGEFHTMERTSTPVFLHYVLVNIVNSLVTFN